MKLHFPTLGDFLRLFYTPGDVDTLLADWNRQIDALEASVLHHYHKADEAQITAELHTALANDAIADANDHDAAAEQASYVAQNLSALISPPPPPAPAPMPGPETAPQATPAA